MRKLSMPPLRSLLFNRPSRFSRLPIGAVRQLVTCYSAWRRSRDIMNVVDGNGNPVGTVQRHESLRPAGIIQSVRHS